MLHPGQEVRAEQDTEKGEEDVLDGVHSAAAISHTRWLSTWDVTRRKRNVL